MVYSVFAISRNDAFPGAMALLPVTGAAMVIAAELPAACRWSPAPVFSLRPVQWLGDNSYSIYLWHWPLIVAAPWLTHREPSWVDKLVILALTLVLSAVTK